MWLRKDNQDNVVCMSWFVAQLPLVGVEGCIKSPGEKCQGWLRNLNCPAELFLSSRNAAQKAHAVRVSDVRLSWQSLQLEKFWAYVLFDVGKLVREKMCISTNLHCRCLLKAEPLLMLASLPCAVLFIHRALSKISILLECFYSFKDSGWISLQDFGLLCKVGEADKI